MDGNGKLFLSPGWTEKGMICAQRARVIRTHIIPFFVPPEGIVEQRVVYETIALMESWSAVDRNVQGHSKPIDPY